MSADLTPAGSAAVRLADALVRTKKQRDRARDLACVYEAQLAKVWALAEGWRERAQVLNSPGGMVHVLELEAVLEVPDE